jgi:hypothetical protein
MKIRTDNQNEGMNKISVITSDNSDLEYWCCVLQRRLLENKVTQFDSLCFRLRNEHGRLFNRLQGVVKHTECLSAAYRLVEPSQFLLLVHNFY